MKKFPSYAKLVELKEKTQDIHLNAFFKEDKMRFNKFSLQAGPIFLDYSKNHISENIMETLTSLAQESGLSDRLRAMVSGEKINETEERAVLHMALRAPLKSSLFRQEIQESLDHMNNFSTAVREGNYKGFQGDRITDIVNIGIGGSDLGPSMVVQALTSYIDGPSCHFVSNIDGAHLFDTLKKISPETTLFLVASKSFSTQETMVNATSARKWLVEKLGESAVGQHFVALSSNLEKTSQFGILKERTFGFWDYVGGRYSVWSAIGLSIMMAIGFEKFVQFLEGAFEMDQHFQKAEYHENMPVILALLGIWYRNFYGYSSHSVLPYDQRLSRFPAYLQQLDMESNGKSIRLDGAKSDVKTGLILWGEAGTNGQHAFYQLLHQGQEIVPCDFLLAANGQKGMEEHHAILSANCLAQAEALMRGKTFHEVVLDLKEQGKTDDEIKKLAPHKVFEGSRPSNMLLYEKLTPHTLGALIALYEHKVFVQGVLWGINSFDQWGVELGKELAQDILPLLMGNGRIDKDGSTAGLIKTFKTMRKV